jgi:hypothetical protein
MLLSLPVTDRAGQRVTAPATRMFPGCSSRQRSREHPTSRGGGYASGMSTSVSAHVWRAVAARVGAGKEKQLPVLGVERALRDSRAGHKPQGSGVRRWGAGRAFV